MSKQLPRAVGKKKNDLDLTPPEEIRARRIKLFVFVGAVVACVLGITIYFLASPVGGTIKGWQSRRLAHQAFALIDQKKWSEANAKARDALVLRPTEPESWRAIARLATRTNQWVPALEWWKKVDEAHRLTIEDRRDLIRAAIVTGDIPLAEKQVQILLAQPGGPTAIDIVFAGQIAARQSNPELALDYGQRALADKRAKPYEILAAATLVLSVTSPYSQPYASAWHQIEGIARDPNKVGSLDALTVLAREEAQPPLPALTEPSLSLASDSIAHPTPSHGIQETNVSPAPVALNTPKAGEGDSAESATPVPGLSPRPMSEATPSTQLDDTLSLTLSAAKAPPSSGRTMSLADVANALENHPDAQPYHKLLALEVRARVNPALAEQYVADAVQRFGNVGQIYQGGDALADDTLAALAAWLNKIGRPEKTLEVLPEGRANRRQDLFLQYVNALVALQRWSTIKDLMMGEHSVVDPMAQHMYLAVAQAHLGSTTGAANEWQRALQIANTPEKLINLAGYAEQNSATDITDAAYSEAIKLSPTDRAAYTGRLRLALRTGNTAKAQTIAAEIAQLWPDDAEARNEDTYLRLLLGVSGNAVEAAQREAQVLVAKEPRNWQARATLGLACLRLGRKQEALAAIREPRVTGAEPPGALAVRAAILAANGYEAGARNDARLLAPKPLLPEERALIAPLLQ